MHFSIPEDMNERLGIIDPNLQFRNETNDPDFLKQIDDKLTAQFDELVLRDPDNNQRMFNNFITNLPSGFLRGYSKELLTKVYPEQLQGKSLADLFADIDTLLQTLQISPDELTALQNDPDAYNKITRRAIPVYVRLRALGYSHRDLWQ